MDSFPSNGPGNSGDISVLKAATTTRTGPDLPAPLADPLHATKRLRSAGRFAILRELGRGGHGIVFLAHDAALERVVAVKIPRPEILLSDMVRERFVAEGRATAALDHPNILKVFEASQADGACFLACEYCSGPTLQQWLVDGGPVSARLAARIVADLADAVAHAHAHGILHRDLKPSNVLLQPLLDAGEKGSPGSFGPRMVHDDSIRDFPFVVKLADFGIAKVLDEAEDRTRTMTGTILGTAAYMSPEQASGRNSLIGPRSDVYALGTILYEMLTGTVPFDAESRMAIIQRIVRDEPVRPRAVRGSVPRDLEAICLKCLEKEAEKRYGTAADLAADLWRFLDGRPTQARPTGQAGRVLRWCSRNRAWSAVLAALACSVICVAVVSSFAYVRQSRLTVNLQQALASESVAKEAAEIAQRDAETREVAARRNLYTADMAQVVQACERGEATKAITLLDKHRPAPGQPDLRTAAWSYLWKRCHSELATIHAHVGEVTSLCYSPDGRRLASAGIDGCIAICDASNGREVLRLPRHPRALSSVSYSPKGNQLVVASIDGNLEIVSADTGELVVRLRASGPPVRATGFSRDGSILAAAIGNQIELWEMPRARPLAPLGRHRARITQMAVSRDGQTLVSTSTNGETCIWNLPQRNLRARILTKAPIIGGIALSETGTLLAGPTDDGVGRIWDARSGQERIGFPHARVFGAVGFCVRRDGQECLVCASDEAIRYWDPRSGELLASIPASLRQLTAMAVAPTRDRFATGASDGSVKIWTASTGPVRDQLVGHVGTVWESAFSPDGSQLASAGADGTVRLWNVATRTCTATLAGHKKRVLAVAFSPDGKTIASGDDEGVLKVWDVDLHRERASWIAQPPAIQSVAYSPDGRLIATGGDDGIVRIWDPATRSQRHSLSGHSAQVDCVIFSPNGAFLASSSRDGTICIWSSSFARPLKTLKGQSGIIRTIAFSPDSTKLAAGGADKSITVWDVQTGRLQTRLTGHLLKVEAVAFLPKGPLLVSGSNDNTVRVWDVPLGLALGVYDDHKNIIRHIAVSPDGALFATASADGSVRLWDAQIHDKAEGTADARVQSAAERCELIYRKGLDLVGLDDFQQGEHFLQQAVELSRVAYGDTHPRTHRILLDLGFIFARGPDPSRVARARELVAATCRVFESSLPADHSWRIIAEQAREALSQHGDELRGLQQFARTIDVSEFQGGWLTRANDYVERRNWKAADRCFSKVAETIPGQGTLLRALVALASNDEQGYRRICEDALSCNSVGEDEDEIAEELAWTCALSPGAVSDCSNPLGLAQLAIKGEPTNARYRRTLGALLYRAARLPEAIGILQPIANPEGDTTGITAAIFLALSWKEEGQLNKAKELFSRIEGHLNAKERNLNHAIQAAESAPGDTLVLFDTLRRHWRSDK